MSKKTDEIAVFEGEDTLILDCGVKLEKFQIAYKTYGKLNRSKSNVVLICHALTGDQYVSETNPVTRKPGWWHHVVGPNKPIDTKKFLLFAQMFLVDVWEQLVQKKLIIELQSPMAFLFQYLLFPTRFERRKNYLTI